MLYPETFGEELAFHDKLTLCVGAEVPVAVSVSVLASWNRRRKRDPTYAELRVVCAGCRDRHIVTGGRLDLRMPFRWFRQRRYH